MISNTRGFTNKAQGFKIGFVDFHKDKTRMIGEYFQEEIELLVERKPFGRNVTCAEALKLWREKSGLTWGQRNRQSGHLISDKQWKEWESGRAKPYRNNLETLQTATGIPFKDEYIRGNYDFRKGIFEIAPNHITSLFEMPIKGDIQANSDGVVEFDGDSWRRADDKANFLQLKNLLDNRERRRQIEHNTERETKDIINIAVPWVEPHESKMVQILSKENPALLEQSLSGLEQMDKKEKQSMQQPINLFRIGRKIRKV